MWWGERGGGVGVEFGKVGRKEKGEGKCKEEGGEFKVYCVEEVWEMGVEWSMLEL